MSASHGTGMISLGWMRPGSPTKPSPTVVFAKAVARHKSMFFAEKAADRTLIDYGEAVAGNLRLVPEGDALKALENDYARMVEDGLLLEDAEPFEVLVERCADIAARANREAERQLDGGSPSDSL